MLNSKQATTQQKTTPSTATNKNSKPQKQQINSKTIMTTNDINTQRKKQKQANKHDTNSTKILIIPKRKHVNQTRNKQSTQKTTNAKHNK